MESLWPVITTIGPPGLLTLVVVLILRGQLIARAMHREIVELHQLRTSKLEQIIDKKDAQLDRALDGVGRSADSLESIQRSPDRGGDE